MAFMTLICLGQRLSHLSAKINHGRTISQVQRRSFAVKDLNWCHPKTTKKKNPSSNHLKQNKAQSECIPCQINVPTSNFKFGIIAAMDESRVIGIDGDLPWKIPDDRNYFLRVTEGRILVIGKNSFYEGQLNEHEHNCSHLRHLRHVVVVSTSMEETDIKRFHGDNFDVHLVRSFEEALDRCEILVDGESSELDSSIDDEDEHDSSHIHTWIGGGQLIYEKAIRHKDASEIRLTTVHSKTSDDVISGDTPVAFFPAKYRWDNTFKEVSALRKSGTDIDSGLRYTIATHRRRK
jgi:dihydrofolate reductase